MNIVVLVKRKLSALQKAFKSRVLADGGVVESIECVKL
jgi:hypothetical protein